MHHVSYTPVRRHFNRRTMEGDELCSAEGNKDDVGWSRLRSSDLRFDPVSVVYDCFCPPHFRCPALLYIYSLYPCQSPSFRFARSYATGARLKLTLQGVIFSSCLRPRFPPPKQKTLAKAKRRRVIKTLMKARFPEEDKNKQDDGLRGLT